MKKLPFIALALLFWSCQKFIDKYHFDPSDKLCKINSIYTISKYGSFRKTFYNNASGNPDSIVYDNPETGHANKKFTYDSNKRLIKQVDGDDGTSQYVYEGKSNLPVRDTSLDFYGSTYVKKYTYDSKGRIIRVDTKWLYSTYPDFQGQDSYLTYTYTAAGNLFEQHDDKINYLRTSGILQFIYRNYSQNNAYVAVRYNQYGFPEKFDYSALHGSVDDISEEISYTCRD
jgi:hypothetical protein